VVALLFAATAINYIDRQMIGVLKPTLAADFHWSESDFAGIVFWFQVAYAIGYLSFGKVVDALGARLGYTIAIVIWTVSHMAHGFATGLVSFASPASGWAWRIGQFSRRHPRRDRLVPPARARWPSACSMPGPMSARSSRRCSCRCWCCGSTGAWPFRHRPFGMAWLAAWWLLYRHPRTCPRGCEAELAWIAQDPADPVEPIGWARLLTVKETWAYALGKFSIDPIWWFFLFWLPGYLFTRYDLDLKTLACRWPRST
jgi:ACS family hexuronate transporter-like MFS transporter